MNAYVRRGPCLLIILAVVSCAGKPPPPPIPRPPPLTRVVIELRAVPDLNPDSSGRPSPLVVKLFELKSASTFNSAHFFSLFEQADAVLGPSFLGSDTVVIQPGEQHTVKRTLESETRHMGLLAAYRDLDRAVWRTVIEVLPHKTTHIDIELGPTAINAKSGS